MSPLGKPESQAGRKTLIDVALERAAQDRDRLAIQLLDDGERPGDRATFGELFQRAAALAAMLQRRGAAGERALILAPSSIDYIVGWLGSVLAAVIPATAYPPRRNRNDRRLESIASDCTPSLILTTSSVADYRDQAIHHTPALAAPEWIVIDRIDRAAADEWQPPAITSDQIALLQYTSGSTSTPKGVMVSHDNLLATIEDLDVGFLHDRDSVMVSWLPLFHDMGLIYGVLSPFVGGFPCYLMPPAAFSQRPWRWLKAISDYRGSHTSAPNFAYELCLEKIDPEQAAELDLSHWRGALNGAEPVRLSTLLRFVERYGASGFRRQTFCPGFGLAENGLKVSCVGRDSEWQSRSLDSEALKAGRLVDAPPGSGQQVIGCGPPGPNTTIRIVDPESRRALEESRVGEIWVAGRAKAHGYWQRPEASRDTFQAQIDGESGGYLRTGDLGFLWQGELYVTGRLKELLIIHGQNFYPQDIEQVVAAADPALQLDAGAAFTIEVDGEERLVVAHEVRRSALRRSEPQALVDAIRGAILERLELLAERVILLRPFGLPKTTSGKIQRTLCRQLYLAGELDIHHESGPASDWQGPEEGERGRHSPQGETIRQWLIERIASLSRRPIAAVAAAGRRPIALDSIGSVALAADLAEWLGIELPETLVYDYPTLDALTDHLQRRLHPEQAGPGVVASASGSGVAELIAHACRLPGGETVEAFERLLEEGRCAITPLPDGRWDEHSSPAGSGYGGFIDNIDQWDAAFFETSDSEAVAVDPQQRLLLEVVWEALERAAIDPARLAGSDTGVFVGISSDDYSRLPASDAQRCGVYAGTGRAHSIAANRISYLLDLRGPSVAVDTACSSSLVALHLALRSLRSGECRLAIVAGVNLMITRELGAIFANAGMLAADGRCKVFDQQADGYVRGEGCVALLLARADRNGGDHIAPIARLLGSAINQDGRSNGLTAPNGPAQVAVIRRALADAGVEPGSVALVEAHGTGTALGDPIELAALAEAYSPRPSGEPLLVGSVKANIGHLEAAAGVAGVARALQILRSGRVPPQIGVERPTGRIDWRQANLRLTTVATDWPGADDRPRRIGISSFGFGGSNAHLILEQAPPPPADPSRWNEALLLPLSASSDWSLRQLAARHADDLDRRPALPLNQRAVTMALGRAELVRRCTVVAASASEAASELRAIASGERVTGVAATAHRVAFLITGQGSQWSGMGRDLYRVAPDYRAAVDRCAAIADPLSGGALVALLCEADEAVLQCTDQTQLALFAHAWGLIAQWRQWGVEAEWLLGHSIGEIVAATVAGVLDLESAIALVIERGRAMAGAPGEGAMVALIGPDAAIEPLVTADPSLTTAVENGENNRVIAGEVAAIDALCQRAERAGIEWRRLAVSHAFHSPLMAGAAESVARYAGSIDHHPPSVGVVSTVDGSLCQRFDGNHWGRQLRSPVRFRQALAQLLELGATLLVEIGPQPVLSALGRRDYPAPQRHWIASQRRGVDGWRSLLAAAGELWSAGGSLRRERLFGPEGTIGGELITLPTYPFERQRYWIDSGADETVAVVTDGAGSAAPAPTSPAGYREAWEVVEPAGPSRSGGDWLLLAEGESWPLAEGVAAEMKRRDPAAGVRIVSPGEVERQLEAHDWRGVVCLNRVWREIDRADRQGSAALCELVATARAIAAHHSDTPLWSVTHGALSRPGHPSPPALAPLWAAAPSLATTLLKCWGGAFELAVDQPLSRTVPQLVERLLTGGEELQLLLDGGQALAPRLLPAGATDSDSYQADADGHYLISGGLGAIGRLYAEWLVASGARHLTLCGRTADRAQADWIAPLEQQGAEIEAVALDIADREECRRLIESITSRRPLRGVVHAAGVAALDPLEGLTAERIAVITRARIAGGWNLHLLSAGCDLDLFVATSSISALVGFKGLIHYAAANGFLDGLVDYRNGVGLAGCSIAWGPWAGGGVAAELNQALTRLGLQPIEPAAGRAAVAGHQRQGRTLIAAVDWPRLAHYLESGHRNRIQSLLRPASEPRQQPGQSATRHSQSPAKLIDAYLRRLLSIGADQSIDPERGLFDLGLDSLSAMDLRLWLERQLAIELPRMITFEQPTPRALASAIETIIERQAAAASQPLSNELPPANDGAGDGADEAIERIEQAYRRHFGLSDLV